MAARRVARKWAASRGPGRRAGRRDPRPSAALGSGTVVGAIYRPVLQTVHFRTRPNLRDDVVCARAAKVHRVRPSLRQSLVGRSQPCFVSVARRGASRMVRAARFVAVSRARPKAIVQTVNRLDGVRGGCKNEFFSLQKNR